MFTIIWNPSGFYIVERLPNHAKMNSAYFVTMIFIPPEQAIFPRGRAPHEQRLVVHLANCSVHTGRLSTDWFEEYSIPPRHTNHIHLISPVVTSTCFLRSKKNSNKFSWLTRTSFSSACKTFCRIWVNKN
jgi:hypothetical protein